MFDLGKYGNASPHLKLKRFLTWTTVRSKWLPTVQRCWMVLIFNLQLPVVQSWQKHQETISTSTECLHIGISYTWSDQKHAGGLGWCTTFVSANQPNPLSKVYVSGKAPQRGLEQWSWLMTIFRCFSFCFVTPENHRETMLIQIFNPTNYMCCLFSSCQKQGNPIPSWGTRNSQDSSTWSATW